ncbi:MAG: U32 family peptidase [Lachnospiraceae bacterium]|nr:U32 family peptidase [Lachnospiraceae bacterium]
MTLSVLFEDTRIAKKLSCLKGIDRVISYETPFLDDEESRKRWIRLLPPVFRSGDERKIAQNAACFGTLVRTYDELGYISETKDHGEIIADASLYTFNSYAIETLKKSGVTRFTYPHELSYREMKERGAAHESTLIIYSRAPLMVSAQCVNKNVKDKCFSDGEFHYTTLKDRKGAVLPILFNCRYCVNVIYNSVPTSLHKDMDKIREIGAEDLRIDITNEREEEAAELIECYVNLINGRDMGKAPSQFTHGHFIKSVE